MTDDIYASGAQYDDQYADYTRDLEFLRELAMLKGGNEPVLEIACGTLRVTLHLARAGVSVVGMDISESMLAEGRRKLAWELERHQFRVQLMQGDMRTAQTAYYGKHELVLVPFSAFQHMLTTQDQIVALKNFAAHLVPNGYLLVDIMNPNTDRLALAASGKNMVLMEKQIELPDRNEILVRTSNNQYDPATQIMNLSFFVTIYDKTTGMQKEAYRHAGILAMLFPNEWRLLLHLCGFTIVEEWGDHAKNPFKGDSPRMLFLARKTHSPLV